MELTNVPGILVYTDSMGYAADATWRETSKAGNNILRSKTMNRRAHRAYPCRGRGTSRSSALPLHLLTHVIHLRCHGDRPIAVVAPEGPILNIHVLVNHTSRLVCLAAEVDPLTPFP